jgi:TM2 domain-containing membrane protein YozV
MPRDDDDYDDAPAPAQESKKVVAGVLGILLGGLGVHKFYLGHTSTGIIQILSNVACGAGSIIGLIEGIIYLTKSDKDFIRTYQIGQKK